MNRSGRILLTAVAMTGVAAGAEAQETVVKVGVVRSMANGGILLAMEKGYFKQVGIKVELEDLQSSATTMASTSSVTAAVTPGISPLASAARTYRRTVLGSSPTRAAIVFFPTPASHCRSTSLTSIIVTSRNAIDTSEPRSLCGARDGRGRTGHATGE